MKDPDLDQQLRELPAAVEFPADFAHRVWTRIEFIESHRMAGSRWKRFTDWISQPLPAFAVVSVMLLAGSLVGIVRYERAHNAELQTAYLRSVSPFTPSTHSH
jgi:hypothetical protein